MNGKRAVAAIFAGLMGVSGVLAPAVAMAAVGDNPGAVTLSATSDNAGATYDVYQIFVADIDASDKATNIAWNDAVKTPVLNFIKSGTNVTGATQTYDAWLVAQGHAADTASVTDAIREIPQNAAEYIATMISASPEDTNANTTPKTTTGASFASSFARYLVANNAAKMATGVTSITGGSQGYFLIVTSDSTISTDEAGTAPVWLARGTSAKTVTMKDAIPTVTKQVKDDLSDTYGDVADGNLSQDLAFKLTGTVADNIHAYNTYYYKFTDTLTNLAVNTDTISVSVDGHTLNAAQKQATGCDVVSDGNVLTVKFNNLLGLEDLEGQDKITLTKDSTVVVDYQAHLTSSSVIGGTGNPNTVKLRYSSNPAIETNPATETGTDETHEDTVKTFTYQLDLYKVDQETREPLQNVGFKIQVKTGEALNEDANEGKYLNQNGELVAEAQAYTFMTDASGKISVPRIDEGVYVIKETSIPSAYKQSVPDVILTIDSTLAGNTLSLTGLTASISGGNGRWDTTQPVGNDTSKDGIISANTSGNGLVDARLSNKKETYLPGTGLTTTSAGIVAGVVLVSGGLYGIVRAKKKGSNATA